MDAMPALRDAAQANAAPDSQVEALIARSRRLGSDRRITNYGGGNTSCKTTAIDPITGAAVEVLWVKGSGGDLGTLTLEGLACLELSRVLALRSVYQGVEREDELVPLLEHCRFGPGGRPPSIETPLHAFLPPTHIDHVHPDAVIALAIAADGEKLVEECFQGDVAWIPWRRPGFELALQVATVYETSRTRLRGVVLGSHGLVAWGRTSEECEETTRELIERAERFLERRGQKAPIGAVVTTRKPLPPEERRERAAAIAPLVRGLCSTDRRVVGRYWDVPELLDFLSREEAQRLASLGTSCPDHYLRTKVSPLFVDADPRASAETIASRVRDLHRAYRDEYVVYYERHATDTSPPMRGADPSVVLVPGIGMLSFGPDASSARIVGEFYLSAIAAIVGAESVSRYLPLPEPERFAIEYWWLEEAKLRRLPPPKPLSGRVALVTGAASGIGRAVAERLAAEGAAVVVSDLDAEEVDALASELGGVDHAWPVPVDVTDEHAVRRGLETAVLAYGGVDLVVQSAGISSSAPLLETSAESWDAQHAVIARGSFLVSREAARVMIEQALGGDIIYIVSKNAIAAGASNIAYASAKADQAHQVRLLAVELGAHGIRVNGINPDGVVAGSRMFAGEWGAERAAVHGVPREELAQFYASRTLLKEEVRPEHVADAVFALVSGSFSRTTGSIIPVDGGVPAGFLR